jgi:hypothetical protein
MMLWLDCAGDAPDAQHARGRGHAGTAARRSPGHGKRRPQAAHNGAYGIVRSSSAVPAVSSPPFPSNSSISTVIIFFSITTLMTIRRRYALGRLCRPWWVRVRATWATRGSARRGSMRSAGPPPAPPSASSTRESSDRMMLEAEPGSGRHRLAADAPCLVPHDIYVAGAKLTAEPSDPDERGGVMRQAGADDRELPQGECGAPTRGLSRRAGGKGALMPPWYFFRIV